MFIKKYLSQYNYEQLREKYDDWFIDSLNEEQFLKIYTIFRKYNFYFIEDIIVSYYEIFMQDEDFIIQRMPLLKNKLGNNFNYIIGNNMQYLDYFLDDGEDING